MADSFDAIVIGGGPGGYNAAIRLGQLGLSSRLHRQARQLWRHLPEYRLHPLQGAAACQRALP